MAAAMMMMAAATTADATATASCHDLVAVIAAHAGV